jgi:hypothetical protein
MKHAAVGPMAAAPALVVGLQTIIPRRVAPPGRGILISFFLETCPGSGAGRWVRRAEAFPTAES